MSMQFKDETVSFLSYGHFNSIKTTVKI